MKQLQYFACLFHTTSHLPHGRNYMQTLQVYPAIMDTNAITTIIAQGCKNMCVRYWELPVSPRINDWNSDSLWFCPDHDSSNCMSVPAATSGNLWQTVSPPFGPTQHNDIKKNSCVSTVIKDEGGRVQWR